MDRGDEFPEPVEARFAPVNHLVENGLAQFLVVRRKAMLHLDLNRRRPDVPDALEEGVEVRDVEVDHLTKGASVILKIDFEPQVRGAEAVLERTRVVRQSDDESDVRESRPCRTLGHTATEARN